MNILDKTSVGKHYFKIALLLRDSIFLNSVLINLEVWGGLSQANIDQLESVDKTLMRRIFKLPDSTPITGLYLESGSLRIRTIIKARRINFLNYLLQLPKNEMLSKFFYTQWHHSSSKSDWTKQVKQDLINFEVPVELDLIKSKSVNSFKALTKKKAREYEV